MDLERSVFMQQEPDSDGVEEFQLRKQTPWDRFWIWLTRRNIPVVGSWQHRLLQLFNSPLFSVVVVIMTTVALFLVDVSILATNSPRGDTAVANVIFTCFIFFTLEIIGSIIVQNDYFLSFFFLCDVIGTLSLIFDVPWLSGPIGLNFSSSGAAVLRASRIARTGTRATRVLRLLRTMRMPAILRCCKKDDEWEDDHEELQRNANEEEASYLKRQQQALAAQELVNTNVGTKLQLVVSKRVIFLVTIMIFLIPLLSDSDVDRSKAMGLNIMESAVGRDPANFGATSLTYLRAQSSCIYLIVLGQNIPSTGEPDTSSFRSAALANVTSDSGQSYALFDATNSLHNSTLLSLGMTIFTIVLFAGGSILFTQDAERLFFKPIERMIKTIKKLAAILFEMDTTSEELALDETILIEAVVARIADIFNVRLDRDGVKRKTTYMKTINSRWRIHIEEEEAEPVVDLDKPVKNKDLLLIHEIEELASLARCLESPTCLYYLLQFLRHEYCAETVLFLLEVKHFRMSAEKLSNHARQIYTLFISDEGVNQLSIDWNQRRAISLNMKTQMLYLSDLFLSVENEIFQQLSTEVFPRFLSSIYCLRLLKHLTLEKQQQKLRHLQLNSSSGANSSHHSPDTQRISPQPTGNTASSSSAVRSHHDFGESEMTAIRRALDKH